MTILICKWKTEFNSNLEVSIESNYHQNQIVCKLFEWRRDLTKNLIASNNNIYNEYPFGHCVCFRKYDRNSDANLNRKIDTTVREMRLFQHKEDHGAIAIGITENKQIKIWEWSDYQFELKHSEPQIQNNTDFAWKKREKPLEDDYERGAEQGLTRSDFVKEEGECPLTKKKKIVSVEKRQEIVHVWEDQGSERAEIHLICQDDKDFFYRVYMENGGKNPFFGEKVEHKIEGRDAKRGRALSKTEIFPLQGSFLDGVLSVSSGNNAFRVSTDKKPLCDTFMPSVKNLHQATLDEIKQWFITNSLQYKDQDDKLHTLNWWSGVSVRFVNHEFWIEEEERVKISSVEIKISKYALAVFRICYAVQGWGCAIWMKNPEQFQQLKTEWSALPLDALSGQPESRETVEQRMDLLFSGQIANEKDKQSAIRDAHRLIDNNVELLFWIDSNKRITHIKMNGDGNIGTDLERGYGFGQWLQWIKDCFSSHPMQGNNNQLNI